MEHRASPKLLCLPDVWLHIPEGGRVGCMAQIRPKKAEF